MDNLKKEHQPIVGIVCKEIVIDNDIAHFPYATYSGKNDRYIRSLYDNSAIPILIPVIDEDDGVKPLEYAKSILSKIDGILFAGGGDIAPILYSEPLTTNVGRFEERRDYWEMLLIKEAIKIKLPIFGICRGMQLINIALGGNIYQDLSDIKDCHLNHVQPNGRHILTHAIKQEPGSMMEEIVGAQCWVNSFHHQAIKKLADGLKATSFSPDNIIEAVESNDPNHFILGVQFHPEMMTPKYDLAMKLFKTFADVCAKKLI